jgi:hypothetical protein
LSTANADVDTGGLGTRMTRPDEAAGLRVSDADRIGKLRRLHNAVALGPIDNVEFEQHSWLVSRALMRAELGDLPSPQAIVTSAADRVGPRDGAGSVKRRDQWTVPNRLALVRRMGSCEWDLTRARFAALRVDKRWWTSPLLAHRWATSHVQRYMLDVRHPRAHRLIVMSSGAAPRQGCEPSDTGRPCATWD